MKEHVNNGKKTSSFHVERELKAVEMKEISIMAVVGEERYNKYRLKKERWR